MSNPIGKSSFCAAAPKSTACPPGFKSLSSWENRGADILTALTVTRSATLAFFESSASDSILVVNTCAPVRSSALMTSRKNAAFLSRDSTRLRCFTGRASWSGKAGEPPPEPRSNATDADEEINGAAINGSTKSRSTACSVSGSSGRLVRLMRLFQCERSSKYVSSLSITSPSTETFAICALDSNSSRNAEELKKRCPDCGAQRRSDQHKQPAPPRQQA